VPINDLPRIFQVELTFHGDLAGFLRRELRNQPPVQRLLKEKTSVKDVIESCGVPHTEVDLIEVSHPEEAGLVSVDFAWQLERPSLVQVHSICSAGRKDANAPRLQVRRWDRFIADGHLGKLARNLRLLGFDTAYERDADDHRLLQLMAAEDRALLTRDRRLLMHSIVRHGYCPRSSDSEIQTREVLDRFLLPHDASQLQLYSRCLQCNQPLASVAKYDVSPLLSDEPLTLRYYDNFRRCTGCGRVYWQGTHFDKLAQRIARLTTQ
jgi:uncharacterized protein with PIN domain